MSVPLQDCGVGGKPSVRWNVLGDVRAVVAAGPVQPDHRVVDFGVQRNRAVVACLVLHAPAAVSFDRLIDSIWGDRPPKTARNSLQRFIADIRKSLGQGATWSSPKPMATGST